MIKLCNVSKTYVSKSKSEVEALKGVSFELGSNGMTFILGKSGSGKSTLLNLLGGLDKPTSGTIQVDGVDMQSFTQSDFESYRNSYVGFVFQEYNLLDDFNVKENIALALQLSKDVNVEQKVIEALKQVELSEEYLTRRVGELSGGEKQRVAIARAIVKESKMILADEPTGNLDSETGESIWNILKNLSQTRPVIIVSHDRESAEKYADRTIEIADGNIIADNGAEKEIKPSEEKTFTATKQRLSFAMLLKMGFNSLLKHKVRSISVILLSAITVCALLISQILTTFVPERSIAYHIKRNNLPYVTVAQGRKGEDGNVDSRHEDVITLSTRRHIEQNAKTLEWGFVDSKQQLLDFGLEFIGEALELDSQSYYLSESALERAYDSNEIDRAYSAEQLVGRKVRVSAEGLDQEDVYTLAGVIKDVNVALPDIFALEEFVGRRIDKDIKLNDNGGDFSIKMDKLSYDYDFIISQDKSLSGGAGLITSEGIVEVRRESVTLAEDEIIVNFALFSQLFDGGEESDYVKGRGSSLQLIEMPSIVGQKVSFGVTDFKTDEVVFDGGEYTVKGVFLGGSKPTMYCGVQTFVSAKRVFSADGIIVKTDSVRNLSSYLIKLRNACLGYVKDVNAITDNQGVPWNVAGFMYMFEGLYQFSIVFLIICIALAVAVVLLIINLISFSINNRRKEIGILTALGASVRDITKIFIIETLITSIAILALGLSGVFAITGVFNAVFCSLSGLTFTLKAFVVDPYAFVTLFGVCFVLLPLFALLPTIRIAKLKPVDAIRVL